MKLNQLSDWVLSNSIREYFCCEWSEDDKIFIINMDGIDVHHFKPNPKSKQSVPEFGRSFIFPTTNNSVNNTGFEDNFIIFLSKIDLQTVLSDPLIIPNFSFNPKYPATIKKAAWSCADVLPSKNCLLAVSTTIGYISIWIYNTNWSPLLDISHLIYLHLKNNNLLHDITNVSKNSIELAIDNCRQLVSSGFAWCNDVYKEQNVCYSYFVTAQKNGTIYIWTLRTEELIDHTTSSASLDFEYQSDIADICEIFWISQTKTNITLILGTIKGLIFAVQIVKESSDFKFVKMFTIWDDEDDLAVSKISAIKWDHRSNYIFVVKRSFLISFLIDDSCCTTNLYYRDYGNLNITSLQILNDKQFCLSTLTGVMFLVDILINDQLPVLKSTVIQTDLNYDKFTQQGMCLSRNNMLWLTIVTPCKRVKKYHGKTWSKCYVNYVENVMPLKLLLDNETQLLTKHWDILELLRVLNLKLNYENDELNKMMNITNCKTLYEIKLCFWLNYILKDKFKADSITKEINKEILLHHSRNYLKRYKKINELSDSDKETICLQFKLMKLCNDFHDFDDLAAIADSQQIEKRCDWCEEELLYPICSKFHSRQFCCVTYRDVDSKYFLSCPLCNAVAHIDLKDRNPICTFCDTILKYLPIFGDRSDDQLFKMELENVVGMEIKDIEE